MHFHTSGSERMVSLMLDPKEWASIEVTQRARLVNRLVLVPIRLLPRLALTAHGSLYVKVCVLIELINKVWVKLTHLSRRKSQ